MERARRSVEHHGANTQARPGTGAGKRTRSERLQQRAAARTAVQAADHSSGEALPDEVQDSIGYLAGADLSSVRVHAGGASAEAAASLKADAYTSGQDIHFGAGKYAPETAAGRTLLTHEIGHALQNRGAPAAQPAGEDLAVSQPGDTGEREADSFAESIAAGSPTAMPGIAAASEQRLIARWGEWCEDLFGSDEEDEVDQSSNDDDGGWLGWLDDVLDDGGSRPVGEAFEPAFAKTASMVVDYNQPFQVPIDIVNLDDLPPGDWYDVELASVDSATGALLYRETVLDPLGGLISFLAFGVESDMPVHARVTIHSLAGGDTVHTVKAASVTVRRPVMQLVPGGEADLDNLVPGDRFTVEASFAHLHEPASSPLSVWPQLERLSAGDPIELAAAAWDGDRMVFTLEAMAPGTSTLRVTASAPGYSDGDAWQLEVSEHATGGEHCSSFTPYFADPVELAVGFNERFEAPVDLLNESDLAASGVEREVGLARAELDGGMIYADEVASLGYRGLVDGAAGPALAFKADQEGTWAIHASVSFTDPVEGTVAHYTPHVANVTVGSKAALKAANQEGVDTQLALAAVDLERHKDMQDIGLDLLADELKSDTETSISDALIKKGATAIASVFLKALTSAIAPGSSEVVAALISSASSAASTAAGDAALAAAGKARTKGAMTVAKLRETWSTSLAAANAAAAKKLIAERDAYYHSPTGIEDARIMAEGLAAQDAEVLKHDVYLSALGAWTESLSSHDAPWSDEGELRVKVRFGGHDDAVEIVEGTIDAVPTEVLATLRGGGGTIATLIEHGIRVEVYQTGDTHFELTSGVLLASDFHTGSAAYYLVDRANARHGTDLDMTKPGAAQAAAWHVWTEEILPLSLTKVLTE